MTLRSVNPYTSYQVLLDLQRTKDQMANLTEQIASGNRLNRLEDDPTASALVLNFQDSIEKNKAYINQANSAASFLQSTETSLTSVSNTIIRLQEIGTQALSGSATAAGRAAIAPEVSGIRDSLLALANTQTQGKYLFAGTNTTTKPFNLTPGPPATWPLQPYAGNNAAINLDVSTSTSVTTNIPGDTAFFNGAQGSNGDIFTQVTNLLNGLNSNNTATIQAAYDNLNTILGNVTTLVTDLGGRQASLIQQTDNMESYNTSLQTIQDSYQALDYPTASVEYSKAQTAQQAALTVLGKSNSQNLFNYLA